VCLCLPGAATLTATQLFAWPAIQTLGAAVGPGIWCGIGMTTGFGWGIAVFGERLRSTALAAAALAALVGGVAGVAASQIIASRRAAEAAAAPRDSTRAWPSGAMTTVEVATAAEDGTAADGGEPAPPATRRRVAAPPPPRAVSIGVACAVATGLLDGSLMAPFSAYRRQWAQQGAIAMGRLDGSLTLVPHEPADLALRYLGGFALGLPCVALLPLLLVLACAHLVAKVSGAPSRLSRGLRTAPAALAGMASGALWAAGNVLSVHATMRLGQAVGFPLTQVCVVISALWGILYFGELRDRTALSVFGASSVLVLGGAAALKLAGAA
jgi:hypothetical protein